MFSVLLLASILLSIEAWRAYRSKHWPTAEGVVIAFYETPSYRYSITGKTYTNSYVSCNEFWSRGLQMRNSAKYSVSYPLEAKVEVYYCPNNPALAALETEFDSRIVATIALLALVSGVCFAGFLFGWRIGFGARSPGPY